MSHTRTGVPSANARAEQPVAAARLLTTRPILLYSLRHPALRLRNPIAVSLENDGAQYIAAAYDLDVFGYGDTEGEALDDLRHVVSDLYHALRDNKNALGPLPQRVWEYLADTVEEVHVA